MQIAAHLPFRATERPRLVSVRRRTVTVSAKRDRRVGGPQDRALYTCGCGFAFTAAVSTSVGCPHCGTQQAW
jgi:hypothetical protein